MKKKHIYWLVIGVLALVFIVLLVRKARANGTTATKAPGTTTSYVGTGTGNPVTVNTGNSTGTSIADLLFITDFQNFLNKPHTVG